MDVGLSLIILITLNKKILKSSIHNYFRGLQYLKHI